MMSRNRCPECGYLDPPNTKWCSKCGATVSNDPYHYFGIFCPNKEGEGYHLAGHLAHQEEDVILELNDYRSSVEESTKYFLGEVMDPKEEQGITDKSRFILIGWHYIEYNDYEWTVTSDAVSLPTSVSFTKE